MPPQASRKVVFDSNIYIHAIRKGPASSEYELLVDSLPFTYLSSVVSAELYLGALDSWGVRLVRSFVSRSEKVGADDTLIALCALQIGARVCTKDEEDFRLIRRFKRFSLEVIEDSL
jgi:predicted nucleic acid-binding protein